MPQAPPMATALAQMHFGYMKIQDWPPQERPREKLLAHGAGALSDAELLALFICCGVPGRDAVQIARNLLKQHGPLRPLLERTPKELKHLPGLGPARICQLMAALELGSRFLAAELERGVALTDPLAAGRYFAQRLRPYPREVFAALFLDNRHRSLGFEELFQGTVDAADVHPREVARRALHLNAAAVIVGHNHPSGNPEPSAADRTVTQRLKAALALVDVRLLDHFVIGDGRPVSLAACGWV